MAANAAKNMMGKNTSAAKSNISTSEMYVKDVDNSITHNFRHLSWHNHLAPHHQKRIQHHTWGFSCLLRHILLERSVLLLRDISPLHTSNNWTPMLEKTSQNASWVKSYWQDLNENDHGQSPNLPRSDLMGKATAWEQWKELSVLELVWQLNK